MAVHRYIGTIKIRLNASKGFEIDTINDAYKTFKGINGDTGDSDPLEEYHKEEGITNETVIEAPPLQVDTPIGPALEKRVALQEAE